MEVERRGIDVGRRCGTKRERVVRVRHERRAGKGRSGWSSEERERRVVGRDTTETRYGGDRMKWQSALLLAGAACAFLLGITVLLTASSTEGRAVAALGGSLVSAAAGVAGPNGVEAAGIGELDNLKAGDEMTGEPEPSPRPEGASDALADYVIYINWDGFAYDYYVWANAPGGPGTPVLNFLASRGVLFTAARNGFPSITNPMQTSIVTGAWPATHGNTYRYYDPADNLVKQTGRDNAAETIAEAVEASGMSCASVQQFTLDGRGTYARDPSHLYLQPGGPWRARVAEAVKLLRKEAASTRDGPVVVPEIPRFLAIYADDLDAAGHNSGIAYGLSLVFNYAAWKAKMVRQLAAMDRDLGSLVDALMDLGIFDRTAIVLTADHGMSPVSGKSSLPDLLATLTRLGYTCELLAPGERAADDTDVVLVSAGLAVQFYFRRDITLSQYDAIIQALSAKPYFGGYMSLHELRKAGAHPALGQLVVWPEPPHHFKTQGFFFGITGQHDSADETSRHVFMLLSGAGVRNGAVVDAPVEIIDVAPTISRFLGIRPPANATGRALTEALLPPGVPASDLQRETRSGARSEPGSLPGAKELPERRSTRRDYVPD
ncbi:MAG: alkaline phosphatase family protein [Betaproteobacteria bacterium]